MSHSITKVCPRCSIEKPRDAFAKQTRSRDGLQTYCKECHHLISRPSNLAYKARPDVKDRAAERHTDRWSDPNDPYRQRRVEHHRKRRNDPTVREIERREKHEHYLRNPEQAKAYNRAHANTPEREARTAVLNAIRRGVLPHPRMLMCSFPSCTQPARHYHHASYDEAHWLDVQAVCTEHHGQLHWVDLG